ncbi:MAG TPA: bifunctional 3,4-dihydroxy-2-butanone-4-phosphate synthase/GTP cyclohydrolase II [Candidatus Sumerlaeota bacterium]|nr:MAG: Riboflavin biosynthesis protein RibBA [candidate division BRC1 bacterium ADurb.Bin183]HOE62161.1 bifunctional 3,4-dihydroxy-2-butanone-4-phosphate synthase/GTP cyclohydrolase II [Candidatus Sumerlaeota bacterium]HRR30226.1 bifunctional 3,4-dihydroxy-2-butanone-4-phosphate synthase/GTP cyclohydrolase II [Candidatus Sumerlaeia bacterium]HON49076.1 bifunctional 3,4-dihydroxy-2-butanone-4-phosphate synthase/GTP cyclohydrolase II [Candidatus Sumerlaeota bacterium]HOR64317.1 bifunctional 3,4-
MPILTVDEAIMQFKEGRMLIMVDDEDRENEGDFVLPASAVTPESINFMAKHGRGLVCVSCSEERLKALDLDLMVRDNTSKLGTNFTISVDAREGTTTGISASDRAKTVRIFTDPNAKPSDLSRPGHIFPIRALPGGVLERAGHTEGTVDLCVLAGLPPAAVLCEIMKDNGEMARMPDLEKLADEIQMGIVTIRDIIAYRMRTEKLITRVISTHIPNEFGQWKIHLYEGVIDKELHVAMVMGEPEKQESALVRVHSQCFTGDTLGSLRCDCGSQLKEAQRIISKEGHGVILYLHQEGRGIGLKHKLIAYALQDKGRDTVEANEDLGFHADLREYGIGAQLLCDLGLKKIRLMTNNPRKIIGITGYALEIVDRVPLVTGANEYNKRYLDTKEKKLGHILS